MAISNSQRQLFLAMVWTVTTATLAVIIQTFGVDQAFGDGGQPAGTSIALEYPLAGPDPAEVDRPSALYAGVMWSVLETRVATPEGFLGRAEVEIDLEVTNTLAVTGLRVSENLLSLVAADGNQVPETHFVDGAARISLQPGESRTLTVVFDVGFSPDPDPATLTLRIAEPSRIPALIPLGGSPSPGSEVATGPVFAAVDPEPIALADPDDATRQIVIEPAGATIDINAGPYRALEGEQVAVVKVQLQRAVDDADATFLTPGYWSLSSTAGSVAPVLVARGPEVASNADEITLVFVYPAGAQDLAVVAAPTAEAASFPLVLPVAS